MFQKSAFLGIAMWNSSRQRVDKKSAAKLSAIFEVKSEFVGDLATFLEFSARPLGAFCCSVGCFSLCCILCCYRYCNKHGEVAAIACAFVGLHIEAAQPASPAVCKRRRDVLQLNCNSKFRQYCPPVWYLVMKYPLFGWFGIDHFSTGFPAQ